MSKTDRPGALQRHDLGVLVLALAVLAGGSLVHRYLSAPVMVPFARSGLRFERPGGWLSAPSVEPPSPLVQGQAGFGLPSPAPARPSHVLHALYTAPHDPRQRVEIRIDDRPAYSNLRGALAVQRLGRYGEYYWARSSGNEPIGRRDWLRTEFRYAFKPSKSGSPQIAEAVEYAIVNDQRLFVVTLHAGPESLSSLDRLVSRTLTVASQPESKEALLP